jgi:VanZ family protein
MKTIKHSIHYLFWFWLPPLGYMIAIFFMSSQSNPQIGVDTPDYVLHSIGYFVLTLLLIRLLLAEQPRILLKLTTIFSGSKNIDNGFLFWHLASLLGVLIAIGYGVTDELHQYFTPGRHCSFKDLLANSFGAFIAYGISMLDYLILSRTSFQKRLTDRMKWLGVISYAKYVTSKPNAHLTGFRF